MRKLLLLLCLMASVAAGAQETLPYIFDAQAKVVSPEVSGADVTLRLSADYATEVRLEASWLSDSLLLNKTEGGVWQLSLTDLQPDIYTYRFIVDGIPTIDFNNPLACQEGKVLYSYFLIDGTRAAEFKEPARRGTVEHVWMESSILGMTRRMSVYLPYGYNPAQERLYPVLYLLHGERQDEDSWLNMGFIARILDNLIASGRAVPMIVVMPNNDATRPASFATALPDVVNSRTNSTMVFTSSLVREVIPYVESHYKANAKKEYRAAGGIGSGGDQILQTAILYPNYFDFLCPLSVGVQDNGHLQDDFLRIKKAGIKLFWTGCGSRDEEVLAESRLMHETMEEIHLFHTFFVNNGDNDWSSWRRYAVNFLPMIFK